MGQDNLRIALFFYSLDFGGIERVIVNLAKGFSELGYPVDIVLARKRGEYLLQLPRGINVVDLKAKRLAGCLLPLIKYLRKHRPAVLLSAWHQINLIALWAVKLAGVQTRVVVTAHGNLGYWLKQLTNWKDKILPGLIRRFYPYAYAIVAVSEGVAHDLAGIMGVPPENIQVIYNPVVDEELTRKLTGEITHPWFSESNVPVIISVGRLVPEKDYQTLIRSAAEVRKKRPVRLMILGEGEVRQELEELIKSLGLQQAILLPGFVDNPYPYIRRAAVFVLSSKTEGLPTALIEALACGTPVVATDCPSGPREVLVGGKYGILVAVGNVQAMAEAIVEALESPPNREALLLRAGDYGVAPITQRYLQVMGLK